LTPARLAAGAGGTARVEEFGGYRFEYVFGALGAEHAAAVAEFWLRERALADRAEAQRRAAEVAMIVRAADGAIAGVCTLYTADYGRPPRPHYFFRTFIRRADRGAGLLTPMAALVREYLADAHRPGQREQGMIAVTEARLLMQPGMHDYFKGYFWNYEGKDPRGVDVWRLAWDAMRPPANWRQTEISIRRARSAG
jgi:hypothetical protein